MADGSPPTLKDRIIDFLTKDHLIWEDPRHKRVREEAEKGYLKSKEYDGYNGPDYHVPDFRSNKDTNIDIPLPSLKEGVIRILKKKEPK